MKNTRYLYQMTGAQRPLDTIIPSGSPCQMGSEGYFRNSSNITTEMTNPKPDNCNIAIPGNTAPPQSGDLESPSFTPLRAVSSTTGPGILNFENDNVDMPGYNASASQYSALGLDDLFSYPDKGFDVYESFENP